MFSLSLQKPSIPAQTAAGPVERGHVSLTRNCMRSRGFHCAVRCRSSTLSVKASGPAIEVFVLGGLDGVLIDKNGKAFKGTVDALRNSPYPIYFVTSEDAAGASEALTAKLGLDIPEDSPRLFGSLQGGAIGKCEALRSITERPVCQSPENTLIYIDDNPETLKAIKQEEDLGRWNLYLAEWESDYSESLAEVQTISLDGFCEYIKWGVIMGVDDGCEPEEHEIEK